MGATGRKYPYEDILGPWRMTTTAGVAWLVVGLSVIPCLGIHNHELPRVAAHHGQRVSFAVLVLDQALPWIARRVAPPPARLHNCAMCVGSLLVWVLCVVAPCEAVVIFLYSKVYEYVDTWIVLHRKHVRTPLQRWHHLLTPLFMSATLAWGSTWPVYYLTCTNSLVHAIMYAYYAQLFPHRTLVTHIQRRQFALGINALAMRLSLYPSVLELANMLALGLLLYAFARV